MTNLPDRIRTYISKCTLTTDTWVTKEQIQIAAQKTGVTALDVTQALRVVHVMRDVEVRAKSNTIIYRIRRVKAAKPLPAPIPVRDYGPEIDPMECPLFTEEERACLAIPSKDWTDACHELCDTPAGFDIYMQRKYGGPAWQRMKLERKFII